MTYNPTSAHSGRARHVGYVGTVGYPKTIANIANSHGFIQWCICVQYYAKWGAAASVGSPHDPRGQVHEEAAAGGWRLAAGGWRLGV
jgi:hypothetical protein